MDPRAKMAMTVQMFMEDIHSDFFEMILQSFNMDRDAVYNRSSTHPIMKQKQEIIAKAANAISISNGGVDPDSLAGKNRFLMRSSLIVSYKKVSSSTLHLRCTSLCVRQERWEMYVMVWTLSLSTSHSTSKMGVEMILTMIEETPELVQDAAFVEHIKTACRMYWGRRHLSEVS